MILHKERPAIFIGQSIALIRDDMKTMTRRVMRPQPYLGARYPRVGNDGLWQMSDRASRGGPCSGLFRCPYGQPGDLLYVKQPWAAFDSNWRWMDDWRKAAQFENRYMRTPETTCDSEPKNFKWRSARFMPKRAAQLWLRVIDVRVARLQSITDADVRAEGVPENEIDKWRKWLHPNDCAGKAFSVLWDSINGKRKGCSWEDSPWTWAITFERAEAPS